MNTCNRSQAKDKQVLYFIYIYVCKIFGFFEKREIDRKEQWPAALETPTGVGDANCLGQK